MWTHSLNPTIFQLGPLEIRWYGVMYVLAFLAVYYFAKSAIKQGKLKLTEKQLDDLLGLLVLAMIVGARLFYAIFYSPSHFLDRPWEFFYVWQGGLSFHGGFFGMLFAAWWFCRKHKVNLLQLADVFCIPLALGNAFGRIGNFINGELWGKTTSLAWGVVFENTGGGPLPRHPTQLYEALYNIIICAVLYFLSKKNLKQGTLFGVFIMLYSISRFSVEFIKDLPMFGPLTMGQWLTIPLFLFGLGLVIWVQRKPASF